MSKIGGILSHLIWWNQVPSQKAAKALRLEIKNPPGFEPLSGNYKLRIAIAKALANAQMPKNYRPIVEELLRVETSVGLKEWRVGKIDRNPSTHDGFLNRYFYQKKIVRITIEGFRLTGLPGIPYRKNDQIMFNKSLTIELIGETELVKTESSRYG